MRRILTPSLKLELRAQREETLDLRALSFVELLKEHRFTDPIPVNSNRLMTAFLKKIKLDFGMYVEPLEYPGISLRIVGCLSTLKPYAEAYPGKTSMAPHDDLRHFLKIIVREPETSVALVFYAIQLRAIQ